MIITDEEIERAEKIFLPPNFLFDEERRDFIKCVDKSLYVQACPGSGKTTALLAKLYILSEKMPFEGNKGICVLTHTNVAIDIIKQKLGEKAYKLFNYPNFFGTIQSFVDKYLAIPAYIKYFGYRPNFIDNDFFTKRIEEMSNGIKNNTWIKSHNVNIYSIDIEFNDFHENGFELKIKNLGNKSTNTYNSLKGIYKKCFENRFLRYKDAYSLGKLYLDKIPKLNRIFSSRFKYVFIDEAQDTSAIQREIIEKCFNENVVIQWIGDINQSIMNNDDYIESAWKLEENERYKKMFFTKSYRISQPIANVVKRVVIETPNEIEGNREIDIKPIIILFDDNSKEKVLEKFSEIVSEKKCIYNGEEKTIVEISQSSENPIKAVGWIGKEKENGLSIKSYFPNFDKKNTNKRKNYFPNLYTMCCFSRNISPREFKERTISCIIEALNLSEIKSSKNKNYSKTELINEIKEKDENLLNELFTAVAKYLGDSNFRNFSDKIVSILGEIYNLENESRKYLQEEKLKEVSFDNQNSEEFNVYENNGVKIYIDTVHGVKGETHTATLYLDTKFHQHSIKYFKDELFGKTEKEEK